MRKIKIFGKEFEYEKLVIGTDFINVDGMSYIGLTESGWANIECEDINILDERDKAIIQSEKSKNIQEKVLTLQEIDLDLMQVATALYEKNLELKEKINIIQSENLDIIEAVTSLYEISL